MDAPPEKEDSKPFIHIGKALSDLNVHTPEIISHDLQQGFLLLEDLGQTDYLSALTSPETATNLYYDAVQALIKIQSGASDTVNTYSVDKLLEEMNLFPIWFLSHHLGKSMSPNQEACWNKTTAFLTDICLEQPQVWVHRDFHSRNLMVTEHNNPGVIDFQDLVVGPISYDLASIFKDCYIEWPRYQQLIWLQQYYDLLTKPNNSKLNFEFDDLIRWYDLTGFQRHLKVLGIFCRLNYRDGKARYLDDLPLVAKYCLEVVELYPELSEFSSEFGGFIRQAIP